MATPRKIPAVVTRVVEHALGLYTLELRPASAAPPFQPGQFLHLALDPYDPSAAWPESRVFSIANSPARRDFLHITYTVKGAFTARMASEINPGASVWIKMPYGAFRLQAEPGRETILIAGGTGITPFISFLQHACGQTSAETIRLFYGLRSMNLITHTETVRQSLRQLPAFTCQIFTEDGSGGDDANRALTGQLDINRILSPISNPASAIFFLSGPPAMVLRFRSELTNGKISPENIKVDDWE